jgi:hypothetical protein
MFGLESAKQPNYTTESKRKGAIDTSDDVQKGKDFYV